jgi:nucleotide-binding universal stress UspA family protein
VSTIIIGVDDSERSEDAIAFGRRLADVADAHVVVANAYPYSDVPSRASGTAFRNALRDDALSTAGRMRDQLDRISDDKTTIFIAAEPSPAKALHQAAHAERASLVIVGSSHTGRAGRVLPGSTGERLLHGAPCSVAVVPKDYRMHADDAIRRIGVAYSDTDEARAALTAGVALARALRAELEVIGVGAPEYFTTPALMDAAGVETVRRDVEDHVQQSIDDAVASVPTDIEAHRVRVTGDAEELLAAKTENLDLLVMGSRGYGPLRSVIVGGLSGRMLRSAHCPVIVVPRGIKSPLDTLFGGTTTAAA